MPFISKHVEIRLFVDEVQVGTIRREATLPELVAAADRFVLGGRTGHLREAQIWNQKKGRQLELKKVIRSDRRIHT